MLWTVTEYRDLSADELTDSLHSVPLDSREGVRSLELYPAVKLYIH